MIKIMSMEKVPLHIELPGKEASIHLLPKTPKDVTEVDWQAIRELHPKYRLVALSSSKKTVARKITQLKPEPEPEPEKDTEQPSVDISEVAASLLSKSIPSIEEDLDGKKALMGVEEFEELVKQLIAGEENGQYNDSSPRATLIKKLETELEGD